MSYTRAKFLGILILAASMAFVSVCAWLGGAMVMLQCAAFVLAFVIPFGIGLPVAMRYFENQRLSMLIIAVTMSVAAFSAFTVGMFIDERASAADTPEILLYGLLFGIFVFGFSFVVGYGFAPLFAATRKGLWKK